MRISEANKLGGRIQLERGHKQISLGNLGSVEYMNHPLLKKDTLIKRKYQARIFLSCIRSNCLVVIPTGLGKTIIALLTAIHRLKSPGSRVIFCAPTKPLVEQHLRTFRNLTILSDDDLILLTGSTPPDKRADLYGSEARCFFMTPQVLQNDIITHRIDLSNISLMIFDESHRATGNYAYTYLARIYIKNAKDPKVLGLTASPGKNKDKILEVMANLYLNEIEIRTEDDRDVKPYIHKVDVIWKDVELPKEMEECLVRFDELKKIYFDELKNHGYLDSSAVNNVSRKDLLVAGKHLDSDIIRAQNSDDFPKLLYLKKIMANSIRISHMYDLLEMQGIHSLKKYLDNNIKKVNENQGGKSLAELFNSRQMQEIILNVNTLIFNKMSHPKMAVLMDLLQNQFKNNNKSRILVFCQFRDTIDTIIAKINQSDLISAKAFVGQAKKGKKKGLTQKEQVELLEEFKMGEVNTLIATSVAEEGLDIAECDVVIFYDVIPSEIRTIQRRGRTGRSKEGTVYILKTKGTKEEGYFYAEKYREREMKRVLNELKNEISRNPKTSLKENGGQINLTSFIKKEEIELQKNHSESSIYSNRNEMKNNGIYDDEGESNRQEKEEGKRKNEQNNPKILKENAEKSKNKNKHEINDNSEIFNSDSVSFKIIKGMEPFILADVRETASSVVRELSEMKSNLNIKQIPIGDYIISNRCGIERKSIKDFTDSLKDGRLFNELQNLREQFTHPVLIIEGNINSIININRKAVLGTITSLVLNMGIYIFQTNTSKETAEFIYALAKKEQIENKNTHSIRFKKAPNKIREQLEYIIAGIPGFNLSRAQDLLNKFGTIKNIFNAPEKELIKVKNIGPKLAKKIKVFGETNYLSNQRN